MTEEGTRRATVRRLACVLLPLALASLGGMPPAAATVSERLGDARSAVVQLAREIEARTDELAATREAVAAADARFTVASRRLALLQDTRRRLDLELAAARGHADELRARLDALTVAAYMGARGGPLDPGSIGAFLESESIAEIGDRLVFAEAATGDLSSLAAEVATVESQLETRRAVIETLVAASGIVVHDAAAADEEAHEAIAAESAAIAGLDASRERALRLVRRLGRLRDGLPALDLSALGEALQGEDSVTYGRWAELFLGTLGAPTCRENLVVVVAWQVAESTQAAWNPLATTHRMTGSTGFNSVGVQNFVSLVQGLQATRETIEFGWDVYGYGDIVTSLRACGRPMDTAGAINASSWCPGCVDGRYVLNVVPRVDEDLEAYLDL